MKKKDESLQNSYLELHEASGIEIGDTVRVLRKAENYEMGWNNEWNDDVMNKYIGRECVVTDDKKNYSDEAGFELNRGYIFPFFVLEKIKDASESDIIKFISNECNFSCQQSNVIKIISMLEEKFKKLEDKIKNG
jgi:hypothetical protein